MNSAAANATPLRDGRPLVYVVDDEPLLLELAATLLEPAGYTIRTFRNAEAALRQYQAVQPRPALIITDYAMHSMTGLDLIQECRRIHPKQKIILVSGTVDESIYQDSSVKPDRFLAKPYQSNQLLNAIRNVLAED